MPQAVVIRLMTGLVSELLYFEVLVVSFQFSFAVFPLLLRLKFFFLGVQESLFGSETCVLFIATKIHSEVDFSLTCTLSNEVGVLATISSVINVDAGGGCYRQSGLASL